MTRWAKVDGELQPSENVSEKGATGSSSARGAASSRYTGGQAASGAPTAHMRSETARRSRATPSSDLAMTSSHLTPGVVGAIIFTLSYMAAAGVWAWITSNGEFLIYAVGLPMVVVLLTLLQLRVGFRTSVLWCLSIAGLAHVSGGLVPIPHDWPVAGSRYVLYDLWLIPHTFRFDHLVHAYGFGVITWMCWDGFKKMFGVRRATVELMVICAAAGVGFGTLNELIEFFTKLTEIDTNVGGYLNTGWDLVANFAGCALTACIIWIGDRVRG